MDPTTETTAEPTTPVEATPTEDEQREARFLAAFEGKPTETPAASETPPEPEPTAPKYRQITEEEYAALHAAASELPTLKATVEKSNGTAFGKIGGIERRLQELGLQGITVPKDKLDRLRSELPEVAELFDGLQAIKAEAPDVDAIVAKARESINPEQLMAQAEERAWVRLASARATEIHSDWHEVANSPEFIKAMQAKGPEHAKKVFEAGQKWDYVTVCKAITDFKEAKRKATDAANARRERLDSNIDPRGTSAAVAPVLSREEAFNTAFAAEFKRHNGR